MKTSIYKKTEEFVRESFEKAGTISNIEHSRLTVWWIKKLKPKAGEALLIAGIAHDIERAFYGDWKKGSSDPEKLRKHQELSAKEIKKFLSEQQASPFLVNEVAELVIHHEEGGNENQNILCDADVLAWLEQKAIKKAKDIRTKREANDFKDKLNYLLFRVKSSQARKIALEFQDEALKQLNH